MTQQSKFQATARQVITQEAEALVQLSENLDASFDEAIALLLQATGRVIISGMGKSGHIGRKIAATLASTGTPAHFVHPAEASHGDLGMMTKGDVVIVLSNSGETPELADLVAYTRRFGIPMIGVASRPTSTLLQQADIGILLPRLGEACGTGVVPTTSTTMTLALGDAIAVALMKHQDFTAEKFRDFHPGGKLGAQLSKVADLMHTGDAVPVVHENTPMSEALLVISQKGFGVVGVLDDGNRLIGIVTDGDLRRHMDGLLAHSAREVMTKTPTTVAPQALAEKALAVMNQRKITCLFATSDDGTDQVAGILHIHDCLRAGIA